MPAILGFVTLFLLRTGYESIFLLIPGKSMSGSTAGTCRTGTAAAVPVTL